MTNMFSKIILFFLINIFSFSSIAFSQDSTLINLSPMIWYEIPNSKMDIVKPDPLPPNWSGFGAVMSAWSGGAYDTQRDRLIIWGGGHSDYSGNEIYVFDLNTLQWSRLTEPSSDVGGDESSGEYPDGNPRSRHTYNYIQYIPGVDRFFTFGGHGLYPSGQIGTDKTHSFDFNTLLWSLKSNSTSNGIGAFSAVDPITGHAWVHGTINQSTSLLSEYDSENDVWTRRTSFNSELAYNYDLTADIDFHSKKFVAAGGGNVFVWDVANPENVTYSKLNTTGDTDILNSRIGFAYDSASKKFVAWHSGTSLYTLDIATGVWTRLTLGGNNPGNPASNGTYGRFRYVPSLNGFILVNSVSENVFFVKISSDVKRLSSPRNLRISK